MKHPHQMRLDKPITNGQIGPRISDWTVCPYSCWMSLRSYGLAVKMNIPRLSELPSFQVVITAPWNVLCLLPAKHKKRTKPIRFWMIPQVHWTI